MKITHQMQALLKITLEVGILSHSKQAEKATLSHDDDNMGMSFDPVIHSFIAPN